MYAAEPSSGVRENGTYSLGQVLENVRSTGDLVDAIFTAGSARPDGPRGVVIIARCTRVAVGLLSIYYLTIYPYMIY